MEQLLKHCGEEPEWQEEFYPGTAYKMYRLGCRRCSAKTGAKRRKADAIREWNNPVVAKLN